MKRTNNDLLSKTKSWGEVTCSGMVTSSCFTSGICHVTLITIPVTSHNIGKEWTVIATIGIYQWPFVTDIP